MSASRPPDGEPVDVMLVRAAIAGPDHRQTDDPYVPHPAQRTVNMSQAVYRDIADAIRRAILDGQTPPGTKLPSIRAMAAGYSASTFTVQRAIGQLIRHGLVRTQHPLGTFVTDNPTVQLLARVTTSLQRGEHPTFDDVRVLRDLVLANWASSTTGGAARPPSPAGRTSTTAVTTAVTTVIVSAEPA